MVNISDYDKASMISRNAMQIRAKINKRNKAAMAQREATPELLPTIGESSNDDIGDDRPDAIADKFRKAMAIKAKLNTISSNAIVDELGWKPTVINSAVTQQMIDEFRAEQSTPIAVFDPVRNKNVVYKYHPTTVDLDLKIPDQEPVLTEAELEALKNEQQALAQEYARISDLININIPDSRAMLDASYNQQKAQPAQPVYDMALQAKIDKINASKISTHSKMQEFAQQFIPGYTYPSDKVNLTKKKERLISELIANTPQAQAQPSTIDADYANAKIQINADELQLRQDLLDIESRMKLIDTEIENSQLAEKQNSINIVEADKENKSKLDAAAENFRTLNAGKAVPERLVGETDEQFKKRLIDTGAVILDESELRENAGLLQIVRAKQNLKYFLSDEAQIETIVKKLTEDERTIFNKQIEAMKKKYLETYGFNNRNMNENDIVDFIRSNSSISSSLALQPVIDVPIQATPPLQTATSMPLGGTAFDKIKAFAHSEGLPTSGKTLYQVVLDIETNGKQLPEPLINNLRKIDRDKLMNDGLLQYYTGATPATRPPPLLQKPPPLLLNQPLTGTGIHLKKFPKVLRFGQVHINPKNLYYDNMLSLRTFKNQAFTGYKDEKISDYLVSLIHKMIEGHKLTKHELTPLDEKERMILDNFIRRAKLHKEHDNTIDDTNKKMKARFDVLSGEIEAGNDNPLIKQELHQLLYKMSHAKIISLAKANKYMHELNEIYFK
jgi:hypothetical protein